MAWYVFDVVRIGYSRLYAVFRIVKLMERPLCNPAACYSLGLSGLLREERDIRPKNPSSDRGRGPAGMQDRPRGDRRCNSNGSYFDTRGSRKVE